MVRCPCPPMTEKNNGPLSAFQRSKIRRITGGDAPSQESEGGEINVVPFLDIITNVLMFVLATVSVTFTATIDTSLPRLSGRRPPSDRALGLTVLVVPEGFSLKAEGGNVASGCGDTGAGLAVPKRGADYDYDALRACATKLKTRIPTNAREKTATLSANPQIPYEVVIATMDAMRKTSEGEELFPEVNFGLGK